MNLQTESISESRSPNWRNARIGWVVLYALTATLGCRTPSTDWNGTWKTNP